MKTYGIDANVLTRKNRTGTERYVSALLKHMRKTPLSDDERVLLYVSAPVEELEYLPKGWEVKVLRWPFQGWTHGRLSWELLLHRPDVFFSPAHEIPLFAPRMKMVATVHDVAFRALPDLYSASAYRRQEWSVQRQIKCTTQLLTVSESTKEDLERYYHVPSEKMTSTLLAIDPGRFSHAKEDVTRVVKKFDLKPQEYFLFVGRLEKKKNIAFLIQAFAAYAASHQGDLVLGGSLGFGREEIEEAIEQSGVKERIRLLGFIPDEDLPGLMAGAEAFVFPTNYEGFGIPVLEAMAANAPLICSDLPVLHEVAGEAALFANSKDSGEWVNAMQRVAEVSDTLREKGKERVRQFSWDATAEKTWEVLRSVMYG